MPAAGDYQFALNGLVFGKGTSLHVDKWDLGVAEWEDQDQPNPVGDGLLVGRDLERPSSWTFEMHTTGGDLGAGFGLLSQLTAAWRASKRDEPGVVHELAYGLAGRERVILGRPRRFAPSLGDGAVDIEKGVTFVVADFQRVDQLHYDAVPRSERIDLVATSEGGWVWPAVWPIHLAPSGEGGGTVEDVGGDADTPVIITVYGPISDFWLEGPGWRLDVAASLAYDQSCVIDTRPGVYSVVRSDGASLGGALSRDSRLSRVRLSPGGADLKFGGVDPTRTAHAEFMWRPAFLSL